jgi:30S ribosomal protein S31
LLILHRFRVLIISTIINPENILIMGKGDKKTRRGKIFNGSYGARRPGKKTKAVITGSRASKTKKKAG